MIVVVVEVVVMLLLVVVVVVVVVMLAAPRKMARRVRRTTAVKEDAVLQSDDFWPAPGIGGWQTHDWVERGPTPNVKKKSAPKKAAL